MEINTNNQRVLVAMSGGVDSSVAAGLLRQAGYEVIGVTMKIWPKELCGQEKEKSCCSLRDLEDARKVCHKLGIKHYVLNLEKDFKKYVIDYFAHEYLSGRTPNPCIVCNEKLKFGILLKKAQTLACDFIATGHYARIDEEGLREGVDTTKDQSYVLFCIKQRALKKILLPIGNLSKNEVREKAKKFGLHVHEKKDSQEICFIPDNDYASFLRKYCNLEIKKGNITNSSGEILGQHPGYWNFTIGQRRGLGIASRRPLYVLEIRPKENTVVVGEENEVRRKRCIVKDVHWLCENNSKPKEALVKIRYNHKKSQAALKCIGKDKVEVEFKEPQSAIAPGQAAVFYDGEYVLGGGWIDKVFI